MAKRIISALLLAASIITFTACSSDSGNTSDTTANEAEPSDTTAAETTDSRIRPDLPETDFDGYRCLAFGDVAGCQPD